MTIEELQGRLEAVEKRLHYMHIAVIVLVGFFVYDILSADGLGAPQQIVRGTVKAQEFVLLDDNQAPVGKWKGNAGDGMPVLDMFSTAGFRSSLSAQSLDYFTGNKVDSVRQLTLAKDSMRLFDSRGTLRIHLKNVESDGAANDSQATLMIYNSEGSEIFQAP